MGYTRMSKVGGQVIIGCVKKSYKRSNLHGSSTEKHKYLLTYAYCKTTVDARSRWCLGCYVRVGFVLI